MRHYTKIKLIVPLIVLITIVFACVNWYWNPLKNIKPEGYLAQIEYIEDAQGTMDYQDVRGDRSDSANHPVWNTASQLMKGYNTSTWWVRIKIDHQAQEDSAYLSIINPSAQHVALYVPTSSSSNEAYRIYYSGWGYPAHLHQDEGFAYPVFKLPDSIIGDYVYLQLSSSYTNNYTFRVMDYEAFTRIRDNTTGIIAFFIGMIVAFGINILFQYTSLGRKAKFYYVLYLCAIVIYQVTLLGVTRLYLGSFADIMIANVAAFGMLMFAAAIRFFRLLLDTKNAFPLQHKLSGICLLLIYLNMIAIFMGYRYWGNIISVILAFLAGMLIIVTTYLAMRNKVEFAKYLFAGFLFIFLVSIIFNIRTWGLIPNNEFSLFVILIPIVVQAILLALGLRGFVKKLGREKEDAIRLYQIAEGQAISKEAAFLQAQIKPHFLFNALSVIVAFCYSDARKAGEMIMDLSKFLRHSFDFRNLQKYISLDEELDFIEAYVRIEQARFEDELKVEYQLEDTDNLMLPPLLLQPLIENAIKHGLRKKGAGGSITVRVKSMPEHYHIEVEDDGMGMTEDEIKEALSPNRTKSGGVGLANIRKRLRMFYRTDLTLESQVGVGTKAVILLPKERETEPRR